MLIPQTDFEHYIKNFQFKKLFNELGWEHVRKEHPVSVNNRLFKLEAAAQKRDFVIFICEPQDGQNFLDKSQRRKIDQVISKHFFEHLIIYIDKERTKQIWQLCIREPNKPIIARETEYYVHQTPENLFQRLKACSFSVAEEDKIGLVDVKQRISESFNENAEKVTKKFYEKFKTEHKTFLEFIKGIDNSVDKDWCGSLMLNRLMFIYFIQKRGFLDNNRNYLRDKLRESQAKKGRDKFYSFYRNFLLVLFHDGLGKPDHNEELIKEIGQVPYLNGGLFDVHQIEKDYKDLNIEDEAFERVFEFFDQYEWHLDSRITATGRDINPDVIGYIFEKYINDRAEMGAYYTKEDITDYISKNTIIPFLFDEVKKACPSAFQGDNSVWKILQENPDRYIYEAVRKGTDLELPEEIAKGIDTVSERTEWNKFAPSNYALPTEIWREVVERRKRYFEIKQKITNGEITEINDLITYNLDIKQFAQDVIAQYEYVELISAFYKSITKITILDPTCGSGAFLFAALNILEPLYEECIDRMKAYAENTDINEFSHFREILKDIQKHPNRNYFIYKSIILNNLYGVDIMNEAVEIAKLRLFLKLVATVNVDENKENFGLEPLPDIDFNIRAGNTLVGFANQKDLDDTLAKEMDFYGNKEKIYNKMGEVSNAFAHFKALQLKSDFFHYEDYRKTKVQYIDKLNELKDELNKYLAQHQYSIDPKTEKKFENWKKTHKPFHWIAEFYEIMNSKGGFDVIIGNPPYIEYEKVKNIYRVKNYKTESCGNLYAFSIERCNILLNNNSYFGMIIPSSASCTDGYIPLQQKLVEKDTLFISSYSDQRGKLFDTPHPRLSIILFSNLKKENKKIYATEYNKLGTGIYRDMLFERLKYTNVSDEYKLGRIPRFGNEIERSIFRKIRNNKSIAYYQRKQGSFNVFYTRKISWFVQVTTFIPKIYDGNGSSRNPSELKELKFAYSKYSLRAFAALNSNLFYWFVTTGSDCRNLNSREVLGFFLNINDENLIELDNLANQLAESIDLNSEYRNMNFESVGLLNIQCIFPYKSKSIIDEIDKILGRHYGFTDEELDFIINYDIKYRMGKELN